MIAFVNGTVAENNGDRLVVEVGGIGYELFVPLSAAGLFGVGKEAKLYTYFVLAGEQSGKITPTLYGFGKLEDKRLFEKLISVSGIGPKMGLQMLSSYDAPTLALAIAEGNVKLLSTCKGIGKKIAERLVLELKEKLSLQGAAGEGLALGPGNGAGAGSVQNKVIEAVMALGYGRAEAFAAYSSLPVEELGSSNTALLVKLSLRAMDQNR